MVQFIKDIAEKIQGSFDERASHPFGGPYLFSWIVCNHQMLMVVFSDESYRARINTLTIMFPHTFEAYARVFVVPFCFAALYVILSPLSEPIVKIGLALSDLVWRLINGLLFKVGWYSAKEVETIRKECAAKLDSANAEKNASLDRENAARAAVKINLKSFENLLFKYLKTQVPGDQHGPKCVLDMALIGEARLKFPGEEAFLNKVFSDGIPLYFFKGAIDTFAEQQSVVVAVNILSAGQQVEQFVAYGLVNRFIDVSVLNDFSINIRLTPMAVLVMNAAVRTNPREPYADKWTIFVDHERSFLRI